MSFEESKHAERMARELAPPVPVETENAALRRLLAVRHGCPPGALYGDDGELFCNACMIDFRREPVERIAARFTARGLARRGESPANGTARL